MALAVGHAALRFAFALPLIALALNGTLVNPAFAAQIGWRSLAEGNGRAMLAVAVGLGALLPAAPVQSVAGGPTRGSREVQAVIAIGAVLNLFTAGRWRFSERSRPRAMYMKPGW